MRRREPQRRAYDKLGQVCKGGNPAPGGRQSPAGTRQRAQHDRQPGGTMVRGLGLTPLGPEGVKGAVLLLREPRHRRGSRGGRKVSVAPS